MNTSKRNDAIDTTKDTHDMTRKTNAIAFPVVLKTLHDHIVRDNANATITTKSMRVTLRAKFADAHDRNASWQFTNMREYDAARSLFDPAYAKRIAKPARVRKTKTVETNDA